MSWITTVAHIDLAGGGAVDLRLEANLDELTVGDRVLLAAVHQALTARATPSAAAVAQSSAADVGDGPDSVFVDDELEEAGEEHEPDDDLEPEAIEAPDAPATPAGRTPDLGVRLLTALHRAGGEVFDPRGRATAQLVDLTGDVAVTRSRVLQVLQVLDEAGHITRTKRGRLVSRIALTDSGLAIVDGHPDPDDDEEPAADVVDLLRPDPPQPRSWTSAPFERAPFDPDAARRAAAANL